MLLLPAPGWFSEWLLGVREEESPWPVSLLWLVPEWPSGVLLLDPLLLPDGTESMAGLKINSNTIQSRGESSSNQGS